MKHFIKDINMIQIKKLKSDLIKAMNSDVSVEQIKTLVESFVKVIEMAECEKPVLDFIEQTTKGKAKVEEITENLIDIDKIDEQVDKFFEEVIKIIKNKSRN